MATPSLGAVLDANVLIPGVLCDTLLRAAEARLYRAYWNDTILAEMERTLIKLTVATPAQAQRRRTHMEVALPFAMVSGYRALIANMTNDAKDRHVLATAVRASAQVIVTENRRHFPRRALSPYGIEAQSADLSLRHLLDSELDTIVRIIREQAGDLKNPPQSVNQVLERLTIHAPMFARALRVLLPSEPL